MTVADLKKGEKAIIIDSSSKDIPLKLLEMGCLPGNEVMLLQLAPFADPLYLNINGSHFLQGFKIDHIHGTWLPAYSFNRNKRILAIR